MPEKIVPINYTSRDFNSIRNDLLNYARRYYPDTYKDFNEAGFGSLMLDSVAYIGDMLSFYLDYQANESFLDTALEYENVIKLGRQHGYKFTQNFTSHGIQTFYVLVPSDTAGTAPDRRYIPILKAGTTLNSKEGNSFILNRDVDFSIVNNEVVVGQTDSITGVPITYAIKAHGPIISGKINRELIELGDFKKFLRIELKDSNIAEIVSVVDASGNEYFEVEHLAQDVIYKALTNTNEVTKDDAPSILKAVSVPRRFVIEQDKNKTFLQFGFGSDDLITENVMAEPTDIVLKLHGKNYVTESTFDPSDLLSTDKMGISPSNTTLTIKYRVNDSTNVNAAVDTINEVTSPIFQFVSNRNDLNGNSINTVMSSLETTNERPIIGSVTYPNTDELKQRIATSFATQNRAVTKQDYISLTYRMPPQFGAIKRCNIAQDQNSFRRNLNLYVISENKSNKLTPTNNIIKQNLKTWLNRHKMINDTIDIIDALIVNIGIDFTIIADSAINKFSVLSEAKLALYNKFRLSFEIGESFSIADIYKTLNNVQGVIDTTSVIVRRISDGNYSSTRFNISSHTSPDGRLITIPENMVFEIKYPISDIRGVVK